MSWDSDKDFCVAEEDEDTPEARRKFKKTKQKKAVVSWVFFL